MDSIEGQHQQLDGTSRFGIAAIFVLSLLYFWVPFPPFESLAVPPVPRAAVNQLLGAGITAILLLAAIKHQLTPLLLRPRMIIFLTFGWFALCSLLSDEPSTALQRLLFTFLITISISVLLLLPQDKKQFSQFIGYFSLLLLSLCYFGVVFLSVRSVHQGFDLNEPQLAGDWRGIFNHKNAAAPAMIILCIFGLFLRKTWSQLGGIVIVILSVFFLYKTNGKTAALLLPVTLVLMWLMERAPRFSPLISISLLSVLGLVVVGSSFSPNIRDFVESFGIDSTFTGRTDIWELSMEMVPQAPLFGQGFQSFWNSSALLETQPFLGTWAVGAAHAHNAYIEALLNGGIPALILVLIWLVYLPARNYAHASTQGADSDLNRLFGRIWIYSILASCLESSLFTGNGAVWSSLLLASFGLHFQSSAVLKNRN